MQVQPRWLMSMFTITSNHCFAQLQIKFRWLEKCIGFLCNFDLTSAHFLTACAFFSPFKHSIICRNKFPFFGFSHSSENLYKTRQKIPHDNGTSWWPHIKPTSANVDIYMLTCALDFMLECKFTISNDHFYLFSSTVLLTGRYFRQLAAKICSFLQSNSPQNTNEIHVVFSNRDVLCRLFDLLCQHFYLTVIFAACLIKVLRIEIAVYLPISWDARNVYCIHRTQWLLMLHCKFTRIYFIYTNGWSIRHSASFANMATNRFDDQNAAHRAQKHLRFQKRLMFRRQHLSADLN